MTNDEVLDFIVELVEYAAEGKHSDFEFIKDMQELKARETTLSDTKKYARIFYKEATAQYKAYLAKMKSNRIDDLQLLVNHRSFLNAADFYSKEAEILMTEIAEYRDYLMWPGSLIKAMLGYSRTPEEIKERYDE